MIKSQFFNSLILLTLGVMTGCSSQDSGSTRYLRVGTGSQTGVYYAAGLAMADIVGQDQENSAIDLTVEATDGSVFNINSVLNGDLDLAFSQADRQFQAYTGKGVWNGRPQESLRFICSFHKEALTLVASDESGIDLLPQIKGARVSIGSPASGTRGNALDALAALGLEPEVDFDAEGLKASEASMMLQDGRIDAFFYTVGHPNGSITEATNGKRRVHFVPIIGMETLMQQSPFYAPTTIPVAYYPKVSNRHDVPTIGMVTTLVTTDDLDEETVYKICKSLFSNLEKFRKRHPTFSQLKTEEMLEGQFAPMHPGAERYFKEIGIL